MHHLKEQGLRLSNVVRKLDGDCKTARENWHQQLSESNMYFNDFKSAP